MSCEKEIERELRPCAGRFNSAIAQAAKNKEAELSAALRPFFAKNLRRLPDVVKKIYAPAIVEIRRARFDMGLCTEPKMDHWVTLARQFVGYVPQTAKQFSLAIDQS